MNFQNEENQRHVFERAVELICWVVVLVALGASLLGCGTVSAQLTNRVACTPDGGELYFLSNYWRVAVGSKIDDRDASAVCRQGKAGKL